MTHIFHPLLALKSWNLTLSLQRVIPAAGVALVAGFTDSYHHYFLLKRNAIIIVLLQLLMKVSDRIDGFLQHRSLAS